MIEDWYAICIHTQPGYEAEGARVYTYKSRGVGIAPVQFHLTLKYVQRVYAGQLALVTSVSPALCGLCTVAR